MSVSECLMAGIQLLSFATLTVLNLSAFVCININQLSTGNQGISFLAIVTDELLSWEYQISTH